MSKRKRSRRRSKRSRGRGRWVTLLLAATSATVLAALLLWTRCGTTGCPDPEDLAGYTFEGANVLLDRHGNEFAILHPMEREVVALDSIPSWVADAFVSAEDHRFHRHRGVDWFRVVGAAVRNLRDRRVAQGASTITMQLARSVFPDRLPQTHRTFSRKALEVRMAYEIERRFSKEEILELYLNHVYLGGGAYGIQPASRHFFDRPVSTLSPAEGALLAALAPAPAVFDPRRNPGQVRQRRDRILERMARHDALSTTALEEAKQAPLGVTEVPPARAATHPAPYFVDLVRQELDSVFGRAGHGSGLRIHTTLEPSVQKAAEEELEGRLDAVERGAFGPYSGSPFDPSLPGGSSGTDYLQGAVVVMDVATGDILGLVGGRSFAHSRFNRATQGRRPVGSAFKPFVVAAALESGFVSSQPISDRPFTLVASGSPDWTPRNHDGTYGSDVTMREALVRSLNVPTARLGLEVGLPSIQEAARSAGILSPIPETPAASLGTGSLSPLELTLAYSTLAGLGTRPRARVVRRVEDQEGRLLHETGFHRTSSMDARVAYIVTDMLQDVVAEGTGRGARTTRLREPVAGKTGTTQDGTDVWFVGYTPSTVATVWIGHDRPRSIGPGATGGTLAAPVWGSVMARAGEASDPSPSSSWSRPPGIVERSVDPTTGIVPTVDCRRSGSNALVDELFLQEFVPASGCPDPPASQDRGIVSRVVSAVRGLFGGGDSQPEDAPPPQGPERLPAPERGVAPGDSYLGVDRVPLASGGGSSGKSTDRDQNR